MHTVADVENFILGPHTQNLISWFCNAGSDVSTAIRSATKVSVQCAASMHFAHASEVLAAYNIYRYTLFMCMYM